MAKRIPPGSATTSLAKQDLPQPANAQVAPFRFLDLPPELRMWVYRELLAPGHISLRHNLTALGMDKPLGVAPDYLTPNILRTSKLIYKEARGILETENTICINAAVMLGAMVSDEQVPAATLPLLKSVVLVFDVQYLDIMMDPKMKNCLKACDWHWLQGMTGLKHARICMVGYKNLPLKAQPEHQRSLLEHVIERLPATCELSYGPKAEAEHVHVASTVAATEASMRRPTPFSSSPPETMQCYSVDGAELEQLAKGCSVAQGCRNGDVRDSRIRRRR